MSVEDLPKQNGYEALKPQEEVFLQVVEAYKNGHCPHHAGLEGPHERGQSPVGAFCSEQCLDDFEHEYRVANSCNVNVIRDHSTRYTKGNLNSYVMYDKHALVDEFRIKQTPPKEAEPDVPDESSAAPYPQAA